MKSEKQKKELIDKLVMYFYLTGVSSQSGKSWLMKFELTMSEALYLAKEGQKIYELKDKNLRNKSQKLVSKNKIV